MEELLREQEKVDLARGEQDQKHADMLRKDRIKEDAYFALLGKFSAQEQRAIRTAAQNFAGGAMTKGAWEERVKTESRRIVFKIAREKGWPEYQKALESGWSE